MKKRCSIILIQIMVLLFAIFFISSCGYSYENNNVVKHGFSNSFYSTGKEVTWEPNHTILKVHDGDTVTDEQGNIYRIFAIDTPEITEFTHNHKNNSTIGLEHYWAQKATDFVAEKLLYNRVEIINKTTDIYNRKVASIFYKDEDGTILNLSMELVRQGLARVAYISKTNMMFEVAASFFDYMKKIEQKAMKERKGFYKYEDNDLKTIFPKQEIGL